MDKPKIFVSSTIRDFVDLRSALKFYLEQFGFEVRMSEYNDFERPLDANVFDACLASIEGCQYYILLVGNRRGASFPRSPERSITQVEYETAYRLALEERLTPILFVRDETLLQVRLRENFQKTIREAGSQSDVVLADGLDFPFVRDFIALLRREQETEEASQGRRTPPPFNWVYPFRDFSDITEVLQRCLKLGFGLRRKILEAALRVELRNIITHFFFEKDGKAYLNGTPVRPIMRKYPVAGTPKNDDVVMEVRDLQSLAFWLVRWGPPPPPYLTARNLENAILSGEFLSYDPVGREYVSTDILECLERIADGLRQASMARDAMTQISGRVFDLAKSQRVRAPVSALDLHAVYTQAKYHDYLGWVIGLVIKYLEGGAVNLKEAKIPGDPLNRSELFPLIQAFDTDGASPDLILSDFFKEAGC